MKIPLPLITSSFAIAFLCIVSLAHGASNSAEKAIALSKSMGMALGRWQACSLDTTQLSKAIQDTIDLMSMNAPEVSVDVLKTAFQQAREEGRKAQEVGRQKCQSQSEVDRVTNSTQEQNAKMVKSVSELQAKTKARSIGSPKKTPVPSTDFNIVLKLAADESESTSFFFLDKTASGWAVTENSDLSKEGRERISVNWETNEIALAAVPPEILSAYESQRRAENQNDGSFECYRGAMGSAKRLNNSLNVCASALTKGATGVGEAVIGNMINVLVGSMRVRVAVDPNALLDAVTSSGLLDRIAVQRYERYRRAYDLAISLPLANTWLETFVKYDPDQLASKVAERIAGLEKQGEIDYFNKLSATSTSSAAWREFVVTYQFRDSAGLTTQAKDKQKEAEIREKSEAENQQAKLNVFRSKLKAGDETNCGPVIEAKNDLIKVYFPVENYGNEHWLRRNELFEANQGCRFVNGAYQPRRHLVY